MLEQFRIYIQSKTDKNKIWYPTSNISKYKNELYPKLNRINTKSEFFKAVIRKENTKRGNVKC